MNNLKEKAKRILERLKQRENFKIKADFDICPIDEKKASIEDYDIPVQEGVLSIRINKDDRAQDTFIKKLEWRKAPPDKKGFWWIKFRDDDDKWTTICEIWVNYQKTLMLSQGSIESTKLNDFCKRNKYSNLLWAGPIHEPIKE